METEQEERPLSEEERRAIRSRWLDRAGWTHQNAFASKSFDR